MKKISDRHFSSFPYRNMKNLQVGLYSITLQQNNGANIKSIKIIKP